tara:strand:- start:185 stop:361 length:177 start_codon:yes stop_codon:yes gene_type:complete
MNELHLIIAELQADINTTLKSIAGNKHNNLNKYNKAKDLVQEFRGKLEDLDKDSREEI